MSIPIESLKQATPLYSLLRQMYGRLQHLHNANDQYEELIISLNGFLDAGYTFNSPEVQSVVNLLRKLPSYGTRQRNFERMYLQDEYTLRKLPKDPRRLPYGFWAR